MIAVPFGAGTFIKDDSQSMSDETAIFDVALGDFNQDGWMDALLAKRIGNNELWLGHDNGVFTLDTNQTFSGGLTLSLIHI